MDNGAALGAALADLEVPDLEVPDFEVGAASGAVLVGLRDIAKLYQFDRDRRGLGRGSEVGRIV
jgi:hypothetical protein